MKPLTIKELKALAEGDWVYVIDKKWLDEYKKVLNQDATCIVFEEGNVDTQDDFDWDSYGTRWVAYKNKEQAEAKGEIVELKYEKGSRVFFVSWVSGNVCEGEVIGWEEDSGYSIACEKSLISAYRCYDTKEEAEATSLF